MSKVNSVCNNNKSSSFETEFRKKYPEIHNARRKVPNKDRNCKVEKKDK